MINRESVTKKEIEVKLANSGDYVKMDYLQRCLKMQLDFDTKKFVLTKLSNIYEGRKMFLEAGKMIRNSADINATADSKFNDFVKSLELFIKAGSFDEADITYKKALAMANARQKVELKIKMKDLYKFQVNELLSRDKRKHALEVYEKMLALDLNPIERKEIQGSMMGLYQKLGKIREYSEMEKMIKNPASVIPKKQVKAEKEERPIFGNSKFDEDLGIELY
jgi:tetratricopeptide (TPR) repeat protein